MKKEVAVIAPDSAAGEAFSGILSENGVKPTLYNFKISPRIVADENGSNILTPEPYQVAMDLAWGVEKIVRDTKQDLITISCNTLSLDKFILPMQGMLFARGIVAGKDYHLYTTLNALANSIIKDNPQNVFLGTNGIVKELSSGKFTTLLDFDCSDIQDLVQEIIWRVKAVTNADTSSAPEYAGNLASEEELDDKVRFLLEELDSKKINQVILGCTELPIAFDRAKKFGFDHIKQIDPAMVVAEEIVRV